MSDNEEIEDYRERIRNVLIGETRAYGFTLLVWSTATMLVVRFGMPGMADIFLFITGALTGIFALIIFAFGNPFKRISPKLKFSRYTISFVHLASILAGLGAAYVISMYAGRDGAYFAVAFFAVLIYNLVLGLELTAPPK